MGEHKLVPAEPTVDMIFKLMAVGLRHAEYADEGCRVAKARYTLITHRKGGDV
jgi:hypothetical protein